MLRISRCMKLIDTHYADCAFYVNRFGRTELWLCNISAPSLCRLHRMNLKSSEWLCHIASHMLVERFVRSPLVAEAYWGTAFAVESHGQPDFSAKEQGKMRK
jgi:hypothetical protein